MAMVSPTDTVSIRDAETFSISPGGAESNVAAHLATHGFPTLWASRLGRDVLGDRILSTLQARGVNTDYVERDDRAQTGVYIKDPRATVHPAVTYYRAGSAASRLSTTDLMSWPMARVDWVHTSGITAALSNSCLDLLHRIFEDASTQNYRVSFDVNYRPALWDVDKAAETCLELGRKSNLLLVGLDEAKLLWSIESAEDVAALFAQVPHVVVKDGPVEAVEFVYESGRDRQVFRVPATPTTIVEPVGAGDAFAAGYLSKLLTGAPSTERLAHGHKLAAWTLGSLDDYRPLDEKEVAL